MKKLFAIMFTFLSLTFLTFAHGYAKPVFQSSVDYVTVKGIPLELKLGKSDGKDLLYIKGWGRVFLTKTKTGYQDINNNFDVIKLKNGKILIKANVTMVDLNFDNAEKFKKGEFYHSLSGYLHSHVYPKLDENKIKIGEIDYDVVKSEDDFSKSVMYREKNNKFTFLKTKKWSDKYPDMAEFKFEAELKKVK